MATDLSGERANFYKSVIMYTVYYDSWGLQNKDYIYYCGASYVRYLSEQYGLDKFLDYYNGQGYLKSHKDVFGKSEEELVNDWINYLKAQSR